MVFDCQQLLDTPSHRVIQAAQSSTGFGSDCGCHNPISVSCAKMRIVHRQFPRLVQLSGALNECSSSISKLHPSVTTFKYALWVRVWLPSPHLYFLFLSFSQTSLYFNAATDTWCYNRYHLMLANHGRDHLCAWWWLFLSQRSLPSWTYTVTIIRHIFVYCHIFAHCMHKAGW